MSETAFVVRSYLDAIAGRDFELARTFLADRGFSYISPIGCFDNPDRFIDNIAAVGPILERLTIRRCMTTEGEALVILDAVITLRGYASRTIAMLLSVETGRIKRIEAIFDATDYHKMFV